MVLLEQARSFENGELAEYLQYPALCLGFIQKLIRRNEVYAGHLEK